MNQNHKHSSHRLLLFVPEADAPEYIDQWDALHKYDSDLDDRGLRVLSLFEADGGDDNGEPMTPADTESLRRLFRARRGMSMALLLDPQGHELGRFPLPVDPQHLLKLVDGPSSRQ